ncbi:MAG: hypothetical protein JNL73_21905 [Anaerolineales bacterium]|nr:hypothetical protein [Anaerolineales bacterium]
MKRSRRVALIGVSVLVACCGTLTAALLFWPVQNPSVSGVPPIVQAQVCVGARSLPKIQVGASLDACWICSSLTPWMQGWRSRACVQVPWPASRFGISTRWGFEFPP